MLPQAQACAASWDAPPAVPGDVGLAEQRGTTTLLIVRKGAGLAECMVVDEDTVFGW